MWLINVTNIHTLRLEEFLGDPPSAYAILSHTWGADEITFDKFNALAAAASQLHGRSQVDINDDTYRSAGFAKIRDAAILAKRQGFVHLWVDTCCINKASSAELSESINSMYLWYQRATICYAYLPDVDPGSSTIEQEGSQFRNSRWFTRGWTLQELIAPRVVEFYASDWSILGTKKAGSGSFCEVLSSITGIYPDVLAGTMVLSQVSVADKMRWASTRQTKRAEDIAYCLLGLFNVNMPLLYGEGSRAFIRLQEEILRETDDQSLFLWRLNSVQPKTQGPETDNTLHGLLAGSPNAFAGLGIHHVRPLQPLESEENEPASMTSKGLKTNMVLVHTEGPHYYALLDCTVWRSQSPTLRENVCIFLKHLWGNQFARTADKDSSGVDFVTNDSKGLQYHTETKLIYVKQQPFYVLPEVTVKAYFHGDSHGNNLRASVSAIEAFPPERFSLVSSVMPIKEPHAGRTMVSLRFGYKRCERWQPLVDVSLALRSQQSGWGLCFKVHPLDGRNLESVYQDNRMIGNGSETPFHNHVDQFGHAIIYTTNHEHRGRRSLQLNLFMPNFDDTSPPDGEFFIADNAQSFGLLPDTLRQIQDVSRQCCYQDKLEYLFSANPSLSPDGVRMKVKRRSTMRALFAVIPVGDGEPGKDMVHSIRIGEFNTIKFFITKNKSMLEYQTPEFDDFRPIHWAAATKAKPGLVKSLASCKADVTSRTKSGWMAVHIAILVEAYATAQYLLNKCKSSKGQPSLCTSTGETLLHLLAAYGEEDESVTNEDKIELTNSIRDEGKLEFSTNIRGELPVHRAAANGNPIHVSLGKSLSKDLVNATDHSGRSVLFHAACGGNTENIKKLIAMGAVRNTVDPHGRSPLHAAVMANQPRAVSTLLKLGANPNACTQVIGLTPLHFACLYGFVDCAMLLWKVWKVSEHSIDNTGGWASGDLYVQPIHLAIANGHIECVREIIRAGCDISSRCNYFLRLKMPEECVPKETDVVVLPSSMASLELAVFLGNGEMASVISSVYDF